MSNSVDFTNGFEPHALASSVVGLQITWKAGKREWEDRVAETVQYVYATSTRETANKENGWSHSTHIPKLTQIHDNLGANYASALFGGREWFTFSAATAEEAVATKLNAITAYLRTKHDWNDFENVFTRLLNDWVQYGNCFCRVIYVKEQEYDPITESNIVTYEGPRVVRISPYDITFNHESVSFDKSPIIVRSMLGRADLMRSIEDEPELGYDETEVARMFAMRSAMTGAKDVDINKSIQQQFDGFSTASSYYQSGQIEILEFVGDIWDEEGSRLLRNQLITVADRRFVLRNRPLGSLDGRKTIFHCGWRLRPDNLWAMGPLDNLVGMQYLIDHLENARADAFDQMLTPDRVHIGNVQIEEDGPVTNYYIDDAQGDVRNLSPDSTVLNADFQIQNKEAQMEAYAGAPREAMGIRSPGEKTKFEVQQLANAASRLFQHKTEYFERNFIEPVLNAELAVAVKNLNTPDVAKTLDDDLGVVEFLQITRADLTARGKIKAQGASHYAKKAQIVQDLQNFGNVLANDQSMAVHFPAKARAKRWDDAMDFPEGVYVPFGGIAEQLEAQQLSQAAQAEADENTAALEGAQQEMEV